MNQSEAALPCRIDRQGWCPSALQVRSPNCDERASGAAIDLLVIHNISLPPGQFGGPYIADLFTNTLDVSADPYFPQLAALRVSSHFLIRRDGQLVQFVSTLQRSWHAGVSQFGERQRCNDFSIGIELEGSDTEPFTDAQYATLCDVSHALQQAHRLQAVTGHQHIAPGRKTDPGPCFDWSRYQAQWASGLPACAPQSGADRLPRFVHD
jgi:AmpD protein